MMLRAPTAVTLAVYAILLAAGTVDAASCNTKKSHDCLNMPGTVSFSTVPDISRQIVGDEPSAKKPPSSTLEAPPITTYTGPTVGINSMARAPTVGYYWSLEPDTGTH
jgi:hypothetical protein